MGSDATIVVALCGAIGALASAMTAMAIYVYRDAIRRAELSEHREGEVLQEIIKILEHINPSILSLVDGLKPVSTYVLEQQMRAVLRKENAP